MPKVLIINHYANPGSGRHFFLARELVRRGHEVTIVASSYRRRTNTTQRERQLTLDGVCFRFVHTRPYKGNGLTRIVNMLQFAANVKRNLPSDYKPDIVIGSSVHPFSWLAAERVARINRAPFIAEVRDLWPQTLIEMGAILEKSIAAFIFRAIEARAYRKSTEIITLLPAADAYICRKYGIDKRKISHISNGIDVQEFDKLANEYDAEAKQILAPYAGNFVVAYAGAMGQANHLEVIIKAAKELDGSNHGIEFILFGQGDEEKKLRGMVAQLGLKNVHFMGFRPFSLIPALLKQCDLNIVAMKDIALYKYGISLNKLFAYFASGKPVVFSGNVINDMVKEAGAGISVNAGDYAAIAQAVQTIYAAPEKAAEMGRKGRTYVENNYDIPILTDKIEEIIWRCLRN